MQNPTTTALPLSSIETAVLETLVYSDVFDYPLTPDEVYRWLPVTATREDAGTALEDLANAGYVTMAPPYITLRGRGHLPALRERRRVSSAALRRKAERYGRWIARLPFVRMVALTGSLAVDNAEARDDIDYLIVVAPGRVWLARTMTMVVVRLAALRHTTLCPNYLLSEASLSLSNHDLYTARELLQMQPIVGADLHRRMFAANAWCRELLPNATPVVDAGSDARPSIIRRAFEAVLRAPPFDLLEAWILRHKGDELRRSATGSEAVFDATMCKGHFEGWRERSRLAIDERMAALMEDSP